MTQEFSLLQHLGVRVQDSVAPVVGASTARSTHDRSYRVVTPCKHPPLGERASAGKGHLTHPVPKVPLADFSGEVMTARGRGDNVKKEYLIYNSRVPSILAVNMQLMEDNKKRRSVEVARRMSPDAPFIDSLSRDMSARQRLLKGLQRANMEQVQRRKDENDREQHRRIEREAAQVMAIPEHGDDGATARMTRERAACKPVQRVASDEEGLKITGAHVSVASSQGRVPSNGKRYGWSQEENQEELQVALAKDGEDVAEDSMHLLERKEPLEGVHGTKSFDVETNAIVGAAHDSNEFLHDRLRCGKAWCDHVRREKHRELMEINKRLAEEKKRRQAEERTLRIQHERQLMLKVQQSHQKQMQNQLIEKRKKQEMLRKATLWMQTQRETTRRLNNIEYSNGDFFFGARDPRRAEEKRRKVQMYYNELKRGIASAREARISEKKREIADERRFLEETALQEECRVEKERKKVLQKRAEYQKTLEEQIRSKQGREKTTSPVRRPGPEIGVLYRCPVTGRLFPPEQFGVSSRGRSHRSEWAF